MNVLSLFDGISCTRQALKNMGINVDTYISAEIDKFACVVADKRFPDNINLGDVTSISGADFTGICKFDLLVAGSPCQGFSLQGLQLGLEDHRSGLIAHFFRILEEVKPKYFLLENVYMKQEIQDYISGKLGVQPIEINSKLLVPQSRRRLYWTNIPVEQPEQAEYVKILTTEGRSGTTRKGPPRHVVFTEIFGCLTATYYKGIRADGRPLVTDREGEFDDIREHLRMLTPIECERLQGLPDNYTEGISNTQRYKALGNGFTVPVIEHILSGMKL
jgi:DNA (cytosine-5)-methyltransferase 3A